MGVHPLFYEIYYLFHEWLSLAFAFAYLERLANITDLNIREIAVMQAISNLDALKELVVAYGYGQSDILQDSLTPLVDLVKWIAGDSKDSSLTHQDLLVVFSDPHRKPCVSSTTILFARKLTCEWNTQSRMTSSPLYG